MRFAYVKSGDVVAALGRLDASAAAEADDGGPDAFLADLLRERASDRMLLLGVATTVLSAPKVRLSDRRLQARTLPVRRRLAGLWNGAQVLVRLLLFRPRRILCGKRGFCLWSSFLAARILRAPLIHSRHNWLEEQGTGGRLATILDNWVVRRADAVICHGPYLRDRLAAIGVPRRRTFEFDSGNSALVAQLQALPPAVPNTNLDGCGSLLFVGRMERQKGVFDLLDAVAGLLPELPGLRLRYAGDGSDLEPLRRETRRRGMQDAVEFLGRVPHTRLAGLMRDSRLVLTPTRSSFPEGRCMVVMEALALGKPVIAPDFGPFPYLVRHRVNGLLFRTDSVASLRTSIAQALRDEALYRVLTEGARHSGKALLQPPVTYAQALNQALALTRSARAEDSAGALA